MVKYTNNVSRETQKAICCESILSFIIDFLIWSCSWLIFTLIGIDNITKKYFLIITVLYFVCTIILNYRIAFLSLIDSAKKTHIKTSVKIMDFKVESSWSGRLWNSNIHLFYPKDKMVDKFKLYYIDENGRKNFVRTILSIEKREMLYNLFLNNPNNMYVDISYLKSSRILLAFDVSSKSQNDKNFEKAIYQLNKII